MTDQTDAPSRGEDVFSVFGTLTIAGLIAALEQREPDESVRFDFCYEVPGGVHSYRGFYDHLAIGHSDSGEATTVKQLTDRLRGAIGQPFEGWKGGTFVMRPATPVWVDNPSDASSTAIVGIADCRWATVIETRHVNV